MRRELLSVQELANILGINPATVRNRINRNVIPSVRPTGKYRVEATWLADHLGLNIEQLYDQYTDELQNTCISLLTENDFLERYQ